MIELAVLLKPGLAALLGGAVCGIVGVWVVLLNIPFVGVAMSHSAFAGAVLGLLLGIDPLVTSLLFCVGASFLIGPVAERGDFEPGVALGVVFALMLGLAFLGIGLLKGPRTEALTFIWGNILLTRGRDLVLLTAILVTLFVFLFLFNKETRAVLFNREIARAVGVPERAIFFTLVVFCGLVVSVNLNTIGGLLIFSLIVSPAAAAYQITYRLRTMYLLAVGFAVGSCVAGLVFSWLFNLPTGAVIVLFASLIFCLALIFSPKRRARRSG